MGAENGNLGHAPCIQNENMLENGCGTKNIITVVVSEGNCAPHYIIYRLSFVQCIWKYGHRINIKQHSDGVSRPCAYKLTATYH